MTEMKTLTAGGETYTVTDGNAVHFHEAQSLTEEQKAQARANIGADLAPTTAEVGQTIVVKSVDESGKPTEWECVDLPSVPTAVSELENDSGYLTSGITSQYLANGNVLSTGCLGVNSTTASQYSAFLVLVMDTTNTAAGVAQIFVPKDTLFNSSLIVATSIGKVKVHVGSTLLVTNLLDNTAAVTIIGIK